ncbi:sulfur carrier protein ThiS [Lactiplantibacillus sp. DA1]|nr:sulfur carrier protein ThiS [Lactiplantibacillus sp. DA1]
MIILNGTKITYIAGQTLAQLILKQNITTQNIVAEINGVIIHHNQFTSTLLHANDRIELITFVGGG